MTATQTVMALQLQERKPFEQQCPCMECRLAHGRLVTPIPLWHLQIGIIHASPSCTLGVLLWLLLIDAMYVVPVYDSNRDKKSLLLGCSYGI
jgi:hypothetical protein